MTAVANATVPGPGAPVSLISDPAPALVKVYTLRVTAIENDTALDQATQASERMPVYSLIADWNMDGQYSHRFSNLTQMVQEFTLTQELASDLPAVIGFVEGTAATKLQVTLGGQFMADGIINPDGTFIEDTDTIRAFSPYGISGPGPLINRDIKLSTGFQTAQGPVNLLQFTGKVSGYSPTVSTREVVLDCLDPVAKLRRPITIYAYGVDGIALNQYGNIQYPFAYNTQWYIDRILRANGYYASPPWGGQYGVEGAVTFSATMHGSYQHEIGSVTYVVSTVYTALAGSPKTVPVFNFGVSADPADPQAHPFQMMYPNPGYDVTVKWLARSPGPMRPGVDGWGMSGWVLLPSAANGPTVNGAVWTYQPVDRASSGQIVMTMQLVNGIPHIYMVWPGGQFALYNLGGAVTLGAAPKWMFIGVHFASETGGVRLSMKFGDAYGQVFVPVVVPNNLVYEPAGLIFGHQILGMSFTNFSIWYQPAAPGPLDWRGQTWSPTAYVDPGLNFIGGMNDIVNRESYDLLKEIVEAEFGTFYFDETPKPFFRSRIIDRGWNRAPETLTSEKDLSDLVISVDDSQVRNSIDYEYGVTAAGGWEVIWEPTDPNYFSLNAGASSTYVIPITENTPIIAETDGNTVKWVSSEMWDNVDDNPYYADKIIFCACLLSNPTVDVWLGTSAGTLSSSGNFTFRMRRIDPRNALLTITNNFSYGVRFATANKIGTNATTGNADNSMTTEGKPAFRLTGRKMADSSSVVGNVSHAASIATYGLQTYDLGGRNAWRQTGDSCSLLSSSVLGWTAKPKPVLTQVEAPHNPRRRLRDKIVLTEPDSLGARIQCTLYGRSIVFSPDGARDQLTLRPDFPPPGW